LSTKIEDFIAPSRVVGRLPDVTGDDDPQYLLTLLAHATKPVTTPSTAVSAFGVTAQLWRRSTSIVGSQLRSCLLLTAAACSGSNNQPVAAVSS